MKTNIYHLLPATLLALAACSSETDFTQEDVRKTIEQQDVPVAFSTYLGTAGTTRATNPTSPGAINATSDLQTSGFGVFAYLTGASAYAGSTAPNFMYNQSVTYSSGWSYTPVKYWPNGIDAANAANSPSNTATQSGIQYLSFFAYAPYVANVPTSPAPDAGIMGLPDNSTAARPVITYKLPSTPNAGNSVDLLWGLRGQNTYNETDGSNNSIATLGTAYNTDLTKQTTTERVKFLFKHALAKIGAIKVVADIDGNSGTPTTAGFGSLDGTTLVTLEEISIKDNGGTVITQNKFDISTGQWSTTSGDITKATSDDPVAADIKAKSSRTTGINASLWELETGNPTYSSGWTSPGTGVPADTPADIFSSGYSPIMFIPGSGQQLSITVKYVVRTYDANLNASVASGGEGTWSKVTQTITNTVSLPGLQPNTNYSLVMHLGLTSVKFSAEVGAWDGGSTEVIWLPSNVVYTTATTVTSGGNASANVAADATSFTINLTGLTNNASYTVTSSDGTNASVTASGTATGTTASIPVTLTANSSSARSFTITITDTTAEPDVVTTVTINQAAGS